MSRRQKLLLVSLRQGIEDARLRFVMTVLQDEDTDPNLLMPDVGISPLHLAVGHESEKFAEQAMKLLLQFGGNPNVRSTDGMTPVHVAAAWGRMRLIQLLLSCGGDPWLEDNDMKNAFHYAEEHHWKTREMLEKFQELDIIDIEQNPKYNIALAKINLFTHDLVLQYQADQPIAASTTRVLKSTATQQIDYPLMKPVRMLGNVAHSLDFNEDFHESKSIRADKEEVGQVRATVLAANNESGLFNAVLADIRKNVSFKKNNSRFAKFRNSKVSPAISAEVGNRSLIEELKERQAAGLKKNLSQMVVVTSKTKLVEDEVMVKVSPNAETVVSNIECSSGLNSTCADEADGVYYDESLVGYQLERKCSENPKSISAVNDNSPTHNMQDDSLVIAEVDGTNNHNLQFDTNSKETVTLNESQSNTQQDPTFLVANNTLDSQPADFSLAQSAISALLGYEGSNELSTSPGSNVCIELCKPDFKEQNFVPSNVLTSDKYCNGDFTSASVSQGPLLDSTEDMKFYQDLLSNSQVMQATGIIDDNSNSPNTKRTEDYSHNNSDVQIVWDNINDQNAIPGDFNNSNISVMSPDYFSCNDSYGVHGASCIEITSRLEPTEAHATATEISTEEDGEEDENSYQIQNEIEDNLTFGCVTSRPVSTSLLSETDSFVSASEDYIYTDEEEGVVLLERRYLIPRTKTPSVTSDTGSSGELFPNESLAYDTDTLLEELKKQGYNPGPIIPSTKRVYIKKLERMARTPTTPLSNRSAYSPELERTLRVENWQSDLHSYEILEREVALQFSVPDPSRRWREGLIKSSFCYLLLDPRVTCNLPCRISSTPPSKVWASFLEAIFYVGKGKRSRPYSHLYQAVSIWKSGSQTTDPKLKQILDIWNDGLGVVCLHVFQNVIPVEAYTREAAIIDALTLRNIRNARLSEYYGVAATWPAHLKKKLGVYLLHKAMAIFINEGERQLQPADIG